MHTSDTLLGYKVHKALQQLVEEAIEREDGLQVGSPMSNVRV